MKYTKKKKNGELHVTIELDLRREKSQPMVNYNTSNVTSLVKENNDWVEGMIVLGGAYVDNTDPTALVGTWVYQLPLPKLAPVVKKATKASVKKTTANKPQQKKPEDKVVKQI